MSTKINTTIKFFGMEVPLTVYFDHDHTAITGMDIHGVFWEGHPVEHLLTQDHLQAVNDACWIQAVKETRSLQLEIA